MRNLSFKSKTVNPNNLSACFFISLLILFIGIGCKKEKGINALPSATQEGKNTFGCLLNGKAFVPKGISPLFNPDGARILKSTYSYVGNSTPKYYFLSISALRKGSGNVSEYVQLYIFNDFPIIAGKTYELKRSKIDNRAEGNYLYANVVSENSYDTQNQDYIGQISISKIDEVNQFVSGTFSFDAVNNKGEKIEIREGRFDVKYVR
ncbi:MAG: hypothetical protein H7098_00835 [Oligoflexus sp.]|nr:hypothetical protein [Pseudopedobacter sp.]